MNNTAEPLTLADYAVAARRLMDRAVWDFVAGGAGDERTLAANGAAFAATVLLPRVLTGTGEPDLKTVVLGRVWSAPIGVAPMGYHTLAHSDGEVATARAAGAVGVPLIVSTFAGRTLEEIAAAASGPLWLQVYCLRDRTTTQQLIERAERTGFEAVVLTVDAPRLGRRSRDIRNGFRLPPGAVPANLPDGDYASPAGHASTEFDAALDWGVIAWLRSISSLPVLVKGILTPADARRAVDAGASGIVVSNHGGRQLDGAPAALDALPGIADAVDDACAVLLDGGVRRGADVLAALALGADAVLLGRPVLHGLVVGGERGVAHVLGIVVDELAEAMQLTGTRSPAAAGPDLVRRPTTNFRDEIADRQQPRRHAREAAMPVRTGTYESITEAQAVPRLVRLGPNLYGAVFTLMKLLPALYILRRAEERGELGPDTVVVETTSGTFGLALAMHAALTRRRLILVSDPAIDAHLHRRLTDLGATIEICQDPEPIGGYQAARLRRLAEIRAELPDTFCPEQYSNPDNPRSYGVIAEHLARSIGTVDCLVGPVGSGGSMCGTTRGLRERTPHTVAIGVDTHRSVLFGQPDGPRMLRGLGNSLWPANLDHSVFDEVHWCGPTEVYANTRALHAGHALYQGPTSGAAYLVGRWWAARHPDRTCVVLLPDEGHRYQATVYDDGWLAGHGHLTALPDLPAEPDTVESPEQAGDRWTRIAWARRRYEDVPGTTERLNDPFAERSLS